MNETHRNQIRLQRQSPHHSSGRVVREWFYGPSGTRREAFYDRPLGQEAKRLQTWTWEIRKKQQALKQEGFGQDFLECELGIEIALWKKVHRIFKEHGSAP